MHAREVFIESLQPGIRIRAWLRRVQYPLSLQNPNEARHARRYQAAIWRAGTLHDKCLDVRSVCFRQGDALLSEPLAQCIHPANAPANDAPLEALFFQCTDEARQIRSHGAIANA